MAKRKEDTSDDDYEDEDFKLDENEEEGEEEDAANEETEEEELIPMGRNRAKRKSAGESSESALKKAKKDFDDDDDVGEYLDTSMKPQSLEFLENIMLNNDRDWFYLHKDEYQRSRKDFESFILSVLDTLRIYDHELPNFKANDVCFRLHRDIRFSNDKTPYKTHYAAVFSRGGKKGPYAGYYLMLRSNFCKIGAGYFPFGDRDTSPRKFERLRNEISEDSSRFKSRICKIHRNTGEQLYSSKWTDTDGVIQEFVESNEENSLKRCPNGYDKNHPDVNLLMLKSFVISRSVDLETLFKLNSAQIVGKMMAELTPWVHYLNRRLVDNGH